MSTTRPTKNSDREEKSDFKSGRSSDKVIYKAIYGCEFFKFRLAFGCKRSPVVEGGHSKHEFQGPVAGVTTLNV